MNIRTSAIVGLVPRVALAAVLGLGCRADAQPARERVDSVYLELDYYGFSRTTITRPAGKFLLIVRNCSSRKNVEFRLERTGGSQVRSQRIGADKIRYKDILELSAGEYTLTATHDKTQTVRLVIR